MTDEEKVELRKAIDIMQSGHDSGVHWNCARWLLALLAENERLEKEVVEYHKQAMFLQSLNTRLVEMLKEVARYARHDAACNYATDPTYTCQCGWRETLVAYSNLLKEVEK